MLGVKQDHSLLLNFSELPEHGLLPEFCETHFISLEFVDALHPSRAERGSLLIVQFLHFVLVGILSAQVIIINRQPTIGPADDTDLVVGHFLSNVVGVQILGVDPHVVWYT